MRVPIVSWPPLWQYWPAYLALARTRLHHAGDDLTFTFAKTSRPVTDERLREDFYRRIRRRPYEPVIALCEPRETEIAWRPGEARSHPIATRRQALIRRLPLIWRQPHWVLWRGDQDPTSESTGTLWQFPEGTTSGDFVQGVRNRLPMLRAFQHTRAELTGHLDRERQVVRDLGPQDAIVTFTPWHHLSARANELGATTWACPFALEGKLLPGPSRDVTAIQIPDVVRFEFVEYLAEQIKSIVAELTWTQGDPHLMEEFFQEANNFGLVEELLEQSGQRKPTWLDRDFLGPALGEYARLGCYFPYRTLDSAISAEIQKRVGDVLDGQRIQALGHVQTAMTNFLGGAPDWDALSIDERRHAHQWRQGALEGQPLWRVLTHETLNTDFSVLLSNLQVRTHPIAPIYQLSWLAAAMPRECSHPLEGGHYVRRDKCLGQRRGEVRPDDSVSPALCAACAFGGAAIAAVRPAAADLARGLRDLTGAVGYRVVGALYPCLITYSDIRPLVRLFIREQREFGAHQQPAQVVIYNLGPDEEGAGATRTIVGIWWRGETTPDGGSNGIGEAMVAWRDAQERNGRRVEWVGSWIAENDTIREVEARDRPLPVSGQGRGWGLSGGGGLEEARRDFQRAAFTFGYTAVFQV